MMLLLDLGNTRLKWAFSEGSHISGMTGVVHEQCTELDALGANLKHPPEAVYGVSVATREAKDRVSTYCRQQWGLEPCWFKSSSEACGVRNGYNIPHTLGADRWAAMIAAYKMSLGAVLVVDCGTACTIDLLDSTGTHLGGAISPGQAMMRRSLSRGTAQIRVDEATECHHFSRDTVGGVTAGTLQSLIGFIELMHRRAEETLNTKVLLYITGGDAELIRRGLVVEPVHYHADLVLHGVVALAGEQEDSERI